MTGDKPSERPTFELDGQPITLRENVSLNEEIRTRNLMSPGFCDHPLVKNSTSCLLCQVYDEKNERVILACQTAPTAGGRYLTRHPVLSEAKKEVEDLYKEGHSFSCSRCGHGQNCQLKGFFGQPLAEKNHHNKERFEKIRLNDKIEVDFSQCIQCALCTDFEKEHSSSPVLISSEPHPQVVGKFDHNYGVNLIDLCPTGCFSAVNAQISSSKEIQRFHDFCRGCDRLCEIEVLYEKREDQMIPLRAKAPHLSAHWVCDEVNTQWQSRLKIPLNRHLKKTSEGWRSSEGLSLEGPWHIIAPKNLPEEIWCLIEDWFKKNDKISLEFFEGSERNRELGLLRSRRSFEQDSRLRIEGLIERRSTEEKAQVCLIAPEWITSEKEWQEVLSKVSGYPKKVFLGPAIDYDLYEKMDELIAVPSYDELSWQGRNYQNEDHQKIALKKYDPIELATKVFNL